ncbi:MAG: DNA internalization-related competence protein ComEC/Rec2 [Gammaproteobacteria bacterium]
MVFSFAFFVGVLALLQLPALPTVWIALPLLGVAALSLWVQRQARWPAALAGVVLGFLYAGLDARDYLDHRWPDARADDRVIANVVIDTVPAARGGDWDFDGIVTVSAPLAISRPFRVRILSRDEAVRPHAGERWNLMLALRPPRGRANPGGADFERTLFHDGVHALGVVVSSPLNRRIDAGHRPLDALRERIARHIDERVADRDASALISALAVGVTTNLSREQWRVFNVTGTTHLVAISGMHVTLFAVVAFAASRRLWSYGLWRVIRWPRETFAAVVGFSAATGYATLAGLSVPTQRTLIMLGVWLMARCVARASAPFHSFSLALAAVLLLDPFAPLSAGFWLSFGAMAAIILVSSGRFARRSLLVEAAVVQSAVTVALTPLTMAVFGSVSIIGPLVNVAAIPAISWVFVPTILLSMVFMATLPVLSDHLLSLAAWMHNMGWPWLASAADLPWSLIHASPPEWWYAGAAVAVFISLLPLPYMLRAAPIVCMMTLAAATPAVLLSGAAEITVLDVGEGTAIVVQTARHTLVYGTGDGYGTDGHVTESVLVPFLRSRGVRKVDTLVASGLTPANSAGITALLAEMDVDATLIGGRAPADFEGARGCRTVGPWVWDGVVFRMLKLKDASVSDADSSHLCVLLVETESGRTLLPGDLDASAERSLARAGGLQADFVVVPRHGSDSASTLEFIAAVDARWAVVSGRRVRNAKEKPAINRWRDHGVVVLRTGDLGAIRFGSSPRQGVQNESDTPRGWRQGDSFRQLGTLWRSLP